MRARHSRKSDPNPADLVGVGFTLGPLIHAKVPIAYRRQPTDPDYRKLRVFAADPAKSRLEGNIVVANVAYEPLEVGPSGNLFEVRSEDADGKTVWQRADLEAHHIILRQGYEPSEADPCFHQQMVYAVSSMVHRSFRHALGRQIGWGGKAATTGKLLIYPFGLREEENAYYDADAGELRFGYFQAKAPIGRTLKDGYVFTALSHDVVAHELTHALLDGLRAHFLIPSGPDVAAFHEAFADLVALFHHFQYREALRDAIGRGRGDLRDPKACFLFQIAQQFGQAGGAEALRSGLIDRTYDKQLECHDLGEVLLATVFDAFCTVYRRKVARYLRLATGGSGVLLPGELHPDLIEALADKVAKLAEQFLSVLIRAIDYCPPVDIHFGEFLQAMVTADRELVRDDPWGFREALVDAFRERKVELRNVKNLSEGALVWKPPEIDIPPIQALSFANLQFAGEPGRPMDPAEVVRQACALGSVAVDPRYMEEFGLVAPDSKRLGDMNVDLPQIESVRTVRRAGPDGSLAFDLVAEISQRCTVPRRPGRRGYSYHGGSTVIVGPDGEVRLVIRKSVVGEDRRERRRQFLEDPRAQRFWDVRDESYVLRGNVGKLLHVSGMHE